MKVVEVLQKAKDIFLYRIQVYTYTGMCVCIKNAIYEDVSCVPKELINKNIPEFNPKFLEATTPDKPFWWPVSEHEPRIKAFDKLIELYKDSDKEFIL
jgi:hypothetical protein